MNIDSNVFNESYRARNFIGFALCAALIGFAIFSQTHWGLQPCPLCIFQRIAFAALGIVFLIAGLHAPRGRTARSIYGFCAAAAAGIGLAIAGRHVWLQHLPANEVPACGPGLDYMLDAMPVSGVLRKVLTGSGECAKIDWTFLGLSMPEWSSVWFAALLLWALHLAYSRR